MLLGGERRCLSVDPRHSRRVSRDSGVLRDNINQKEGSTYEAFGTITAELHSFFFFPLLDLYSYDLQSSLPRCCMYFDRVGPDIPQTVQDTILKYVFRLVKEWNTAVCVLVRSRCCALPLRNVLSFSCTWIFNRLIQS